jgi:hypothetical protein
MMRLLLMEKLGIFIPPSAPKSVWIKTLTKVLSNPNHIKQMGENLHKVTEEYFDANKVVKHRLELYQQSLELVSSGDKDSKITYNADWKYE